MPYEKRQDIISLRLKLRENVAQFGARFERSGRTVEDWEQGRKTPDKLCQRLLDSLAESPEIAAKQ